MTQRNFIGTVIMIAVALFWVAGCSTFSGTKSKTTKKKAPQKTMYAQVPSAMRAPVNDASDAERRAKANLKLANEQVKLADLKKERAILEKKRADQNQKLAKTMAEKAGIIVERKKLEAIDKANLGDKADNIKKIANLKTKELSIESNAVKTRADIATLDIEIQKLTRKVNVQAGRVDSAK